MIHDNVLDAIGNTPIVRLNRMVGDDCAEVLVKLESLNVGGSIKTRTAYEMISRAEKAGRLTPESIIIEPTSGNQGIGLALIGAVKGYKTIIIMPDSVSEERRKLCEHYGAKVVLIHDDGNIGKCISECAYTAVRMAQMNSHVFVPQQFINRDNPLAHYTRTGEEIIQQVGKPIHGFVSGIGTGGTISGIGKILRENNPDIEIWALEPENAAILSKGPITTHLQMGIGDGIIPANLDQKIYDSVHIITDEEAIQTSKDLARLEGLAVGVSSGTNVCAALQLAKKLGPGKTVVTVLPDTAERYFSTPLFE
ncbi:MAG: cysteine synthase family protein [Clostridiales bacterium]|nr:cysteine synthase family protein [Candidatus Crickella equi]